MMYVQTGCPLSKKKNDEQTQLVQQVPGQVRTHLGSTHKPTSPQAVQYSAVRSGIPVHSTGTIITELQ